MKLVLSDKFTDMGSEMSALMGYTYMLDSDPISIGVLKQTFDSFVAAGTSTAISAEEYGATVIQLLKLDTKVVKDSNLIYFVNEIAATDTTPATTAITFLYKSQSAFWQLKFLTFTETYAAHKADIFKYASSVTFAG